jgi:hypothetical protein
MTHFFLTEKIHFFKKRSHFMYTLQNVLKYFQNINPTIKIYVLSLILSRGRKNCSAMAGSIGVSPKKLYAFLNEAKKNAGIMEQALLNIARETHIKGVARALIVDPSTIVKQYSQKIESVCYDRSGCTKHVERCLVPAYVIIADKNITIPLSLDFWVQEKVIGTSKYRSKIEIAKQLILYAIKQGIEFDYVSLDGAFAVEEMLSFLRDNNLKFIIRIPKTRRIDTEDGTSAQLQKHPALRLRRNERAKSCQAKIRGNTYFFTAEKRKNRHDDWEVVFLISNMDLTAKQQIEAYNLRWPIEKMIRTNKQKFGTTQCQVIKKEKQRAHILAGFLAYALLSFMKNDKKKQSVDEVVNILRKSDYGDLFSKMKKSKNYNHYEKANVIAKSIQNNPTPFSYYQDTISLIMH